MKLKPLIAPQSIAVVGASQTKTKLGHQILAKLKTSAGGRLNIYPINPKPDKILGLRPYPDVGSIGQPIDLAIYVVPAPVVVNQLAKDAPHLRSAIVISAGFAETNRAGASLEKQLSRIAENHHLPLLGPNCLGLLNPPFINASFARRMPTAGSISFISQSGALGTALMDMLAAENIGLSSFISLGNKAVIDESDLLEYLDSDQTTTQIALYLENIKRPEKFYQIASRVVQKKPIILLLGGRSQTASQAIKSHTGKAASPAKIALASASQYGVIPVADLRQLVNLVKLFQSHQALYDSDVAILTNAGGGGILAVDALSKTQLQLSRLTPATKSKLIAILPAAASVQNPVDMLGDATSERIAASLSVLLKDKICDVVLLVLSPQTTTDYANIAQAVVSQAKQHPTKPIITCFLSGRASIPAEKILRRHDLTFYHFPAESLNVLNLWFRYYQTRHQINYPVQKISAVPSATFKTRYSKLLAAQPNNTILPLAITFPLMAKYGLKLAPYAIVKTASQALLAADRLGYPVALKTADRQSDHKLAAGELVTQIETPHSLRRAYKQLSRIDDSILVQKMISSRLELFLGLTRLPEYGTNIIFGTGGIYTNIFNDFSILHVPFDHHMATNCISRTKAYQTIKMATPDADKLINRLINWFDHLATLAADFPAINQIDLNPAIFDGNKLQLVDLKIRLRFD